MTAEFFKRLVNSSADGILAFDREYRYTAWNRAMERFFGISQAEVLGKYAFDLFPFLKETGEDKFYVEALSGKTVIAKDRPYVIPETGQSGFFEGHYSPLIDESGEIVGGVAIIHDVTEGEQHLLTEILVRVGLALNAILDLPDLLDFICQESVRLFEVDAAYVWLVQANELVGFAGHGLGREKFIGRRIPLSDRYALGPRVIREERPIFINDTPNSKGVNREFVKLFQVNAILGTPLMKGGRAVGVLMIIDAHQPQRFGPNDLKIAMVLGNYAAIAIENARLFEAEVQRRYEAETLREAIAALSSALDLKQVLDGILIHLEQLVPYDRACVLLLEGDRLHAVAGRGLPAMEEMIGRDFPADDDVVLRQLQQTQRPLYLSDAQADPRLQRWIGSEDIHSWMGVPLLAHGGEMKGYLTLNSRRMAAYGETEAARAQAFVNQAAIAIENARLYEALQIAHDELEMRVQERTAKLEQAMAETAAARDRIDAILRSVADGLIVTDLDHKVILANPAAEALLGLRLEEMLGQEIGNGIKDNQLREIVRSTLDQQTDGYEIDIKLEDTRNQRYRVMRARTALVGDRQGQPLGTVTIIQDVTRLREVDRLKTELLTTAAHELRTPLTSILGFSEILLTRELNQVRQHYYLRLINEQSAHLAKIIKDLLDVSRLEAGRGLDLKLEPIDMAGLMKEVVMPFIETTTKHNIQVEGLEKLPSIMGDPFRLAQVGRNLLSNAINYSPHGGTITIRGRTIPGHLEISLQDEGIGLTPEQQAHLFEPFYRVDTSHTAIGGTGLGLAICKLIVEQHDGEIWLDSEWGKGTTVHFTLPLDKSQARE